MATSNNVVGLSNIGNAIQVRNIDELRNTYITVGCYRETGRLDRVLDTFHKALTLAHRDERDWDLITQLVSLHDHKGELTAQWRDAIAARSLVKYVNAAWEDQCECHVIHKAEEVFATLGDPALP